MDEIDNLERVFAEVIREARRNASFASRLRRAGNSGVTDSLTTRAKGRHVEASAAPVTAGRRHRRAPPMIDALAIYQQEGEDRLRSALTALTVEQLKDVVAEHGMDTHKLAMKWRSRERLEHLIVTSIRERLAKGSVFRQAPLR